MPRIIMVKILIGTTCFKLKTSSADIAAASIGNKTGFRLNGCALAIKFIIHTTGSSVLTAQAKAMALNPSHLIDKKASSQLVIVHIDMILKSSFTAPSPFNVLSPTVVKLANK